MKRYLITKAFLMFLILCLKVSAQEFNTLTTDEKTEKPMLIGYTTLEAFKDTSFSWWWDSGYIMYDPDSATSDQLRTLMDSEDIKIVMGTWCSDSRREVPHFYKLLDAINYPKESVILINVNRDKVGLGDEVEGMNIEFVPTFIFSKNGEELGRIVETPYESLEKDMLEIILGEDKK